MVVKQLGFPESAIALFPLLRSILQLAFYFFITPRLDHFRYRNPFLIGFAMLIASNAILFPLGRDSRGEREPGMSS